MEADLIKQYLDNSIRHWRIQRDSHDCKYALYYIDAFQSMRLSIFGEILPEERNGNEQQT